MAGIYIHIPFCKGRCQYCAFFSTTRHDDMDRYVQDICLELEMRRDYLNGADIDTVYFGGGTPSQLSPEQMALILDRIPAISIRELTVECNPDDVTAEYIGSLHSLGTNRISMGVQTFNDGLLATLGRRHDARQAANAVSDCHKGGIDNISIDLMYGLPGQTPEMQKTDLECATSLDVTHISSYCLSYEEGTPIFRFRNQGASDELCRSMFHAMCAHMKEHGFRHYEISNFAKPGFESAHNSSYWNGTPYLGVGAGAHSFNGKSRSWNVSDLDAYMKGIECGSPVSETEILTATDMYNEKIMLGLRTAGGIEADERLERAARRYLESGQMVKEKGRLRLTEDSLFISDYIISDLFEDQIID